jgi:hypothetical protein
LCGIHSLIETFEESFSKISVRCSQVPISPTSKKNMAKCQPGRYLGLRYMLNVLTSMYGIQSSKMINVVIRWVERPSRNLFHLAKHLRLLQHVVSIHLPQTIGMSLSENRSFRRKRKMCLCSSTSRGVIPTNDASGISQIEIFFQLRPTLALRPQLEPFVQKYRSASAWLIAHRFLVTITTVKGDEIAAYHCPDKLRQIQGVPPTHEHLDPGMELDSGSSNAMEMGPADAEWMIRNA